MEDLFNECTKLFRLNMPCLNGWRPYSILILDSISEEVQGKKKKKKFFFLYFSVDWIYDSSTSFQILSGFALFSVIFRITQI